MNINTLQHLVEFFPTFSSKWVLAQLDSRADVWRKTYGLDFDERTRWHDIWHVVAGTDPSYPGEAYTDCFQMGIQARSFIWENAFAYSQAIEEIGYTYYLKGKSLKPRFKKLISNF